MKAKYIPTLFSKLLFGLLMISSLAFSASRFSGAVPVIQNFTNENSAYITAFREPGQDFVYEISPSSAKFSVKSNDVGFGHVTDILDITNLEAGVDYQLTIKSRTGAVLDTRSFRSIDQNMNSPKVAVCSCLRQGVLSPDDPFKPMATQLMEKNPDAIFFLGDLVYGDNALEATIKYFFGKHPNMNKIKKRYIQSWKKEKLYRQPKLVPMYSVWDDHDYGFDGADISNPYKKEMMALYRAYYPVPDSSQVISRGPGVSYSFNIFGKKFLMLDNRSFYSSKGKTLLGEEQIKWIENEIKSQREVIIASGMSIINLSEKEESLQRDAPSEWSQFREIFKRHPVKAVFLTGDVHFSEVRLVPEHVLGFQTYQVVSSPIKSTSRYITPPFTSGRQKKDKNQLAFLHGANFAILAMNDLFKKLDVTFHRGWKRSPITLTGSYVQTSCEKFYASSAGQ